MFADLCHFSVRSVQVNENVIMGSFHEIRCHCFNCINMLAFDSFINHLHSFCIQLTYAFLVLPCLLLGYLGQAAYLMNNHADTTHAFFASTPSKLHN